MATPTPSKTTITLSPSTRTAYDLAKAEHPELTLNEFINTAVHFYTQYGNEPGFDVMLRRLGTLEKHLSDLLARQPPELREIREVDPAALAAEVVSQLRPLMRSISPPHVPKWRQWLIRRRRDIPVEHW